MRDSLIKILLVEDNEADVRLTKEAFSDSSFRIDFTVARNGEEVVHVFENADYRPHLILLDLNLPKIDGKQVLKILKTDEKLKSIPVIVLSTSVYHQDINDVYFLQANCYLKKPVDFDSFSELVKQIELFWLMTVRLPTI